MTVFVFIRQKTAKFKEYFRGKMLRNQKVVIYPKLLILKQRESVPAL